MRPSPHFLQMLNQLQMKVRHATASTGIGERRSRSKGMGMEFADYREYVPGDDTRHLDARLHARLGDLYVREYEVLRQLPVQILIDGSRSMQEKFDVARWLANALGYLALAGGDRAQFAFWSGKRLTLSPRFQGVSRAERMFEWVEDVEADGREPFDAALPELATHMVPNGLAVVISDFWVADPARAIQLIAASGGEIWALQVLTPGELDPAQMPQGEVRLVDAESGEEILVPLDRNTLAQYRRTMGEWQAGLTETIHGALGQHLLFRTDDNLEKRLLDLRTAGLLT